jgi:hypothetical protein
LVIAGVMLSQHRALNAALLVWGILTLVLVVADIATVSGVAAFAAVMNSATAATNATPRELRSFWLSNRTTAIVATSWRLGAAAVGGALCYFDRRRSRNEKLA